MTAAPAVRSYVTVEIAGQHFGIAIERVREVFSPGRLTHVPLAPADVAGVLNLRGRIVIAIDARALLELPARAPDAKPMAVGIDQKTEAFALLVDKIGDVVELSDGDREPTPGTLKPAWARVSEGVHRRGDRLLLILDVDRALAAPVSAAA